MNQQIWMTFQGYFLRISKNCIFVLIFQFDCFVLVMISDLESLLYYAHIDFGRVTTQNHSTLCSLTKYPVFQFDDNNIFDDQTSLESNFIDNPTSSNQHNFQNRMTKWCRKNIFP